MRALRFSSPEETPPAHASFLPLLPVNERLVPGYDGFGHSLFRLRRFKPSRVWTKHRRVFHDGHHYKVGFTVRSSFLSFTILFTALVILLYAYLGRRLFSFGWPHSRWGWWFLAVLFFFSYLMPFFLFWRTRQPSQVAAPDLLFWVVYLSMSLVSEILTVVVLRDLLFLLAKGGAWASPATLGAWPGALETSLVSRLLLSIALLLTALGLFQAHRAPAIKRVEISIAGLPEAFDGYKVALLSDLHVGPTIKKPFVAQAVSIVNSLQPDLVALPGDVPDGTASSLGGDVSPLAEMKAKDGLFYTTGNHEYYWGADAWISKMRELGWTVLNNEHRIIQRGSSSLVVAGITDSTAVHMDPPNAPNGIQALEGTPTNTVVLWLSHQPRGVRQVAHLRNGLMLSGHTHDGQFFPWTLALKLFEPYEKGLYRVGDVDLYVTPGTGYWGPPNRLGTRSEITLLTLRSAQAK